MKPQINLQQVVRILARVSAVGVVIVGIVSRFDPPTAVRLAWWVVLIALIDFGLYLHELSFQYEGGAWMLLALFSFLVCLYLQSLAQRLDCPPIEYRGRLIASALPSPDNPCLTMKERLMRTKPAGTIKPFPPETVFLFLGSEASYIQTQGRWPIVNDKGQVLLTADFEEKGLSVTTQLYDEQGNLQATVDNNDVDVLSADICVRRPDLSTLTISDRSTKQERLYVHYLNPRAVEFRGLLRYPNLPDVAITKEAIKYEQVSVTRSCLPAASPDGMIMIYLWDQFKTAHYRNFHAETPARRF